MADPANLDLLTLTAQISAAYVAANTIDAVSVPALVSDVYQALTRAGAPVPEPVRKEPAVPVNRSFRPDYLVCLEDGARVNMLKQYLKRFDLTPDAYRAKWGLPLDYPMVAPAYAARRSEIAKQARLSRTASRPTDVEPPPPPAEEEGTRHTAASVFANFPDAEPVVEVAAAQGAPERSTRKRFAQQSVRSIARKSR